MTAIFVSDLVSESEVVLVNTRSADRALLLCNLCFQLSGHGQSRSGLFWSSEPSDVVMD
jgi:hypothetical protein